MATRKVFKTDRFTAYELEVFTRRLSLAVEARDAFTREFPAIPVNVTLKEMIDGELAETSFKPIRNLSGYYCFIDLPVSEEYGLEVAVDPAKDDWFFPAQISPGDIKVRDGDFDAAKHVATVDLRVKPAYPFPATATLICGSALFFFTDGDGVEQKIPIFPAQVVVADQATDVKLFETETDDLGGFVIFFKAKDLPAGKIKMDLTGEAEGQPVAVGETDIEIEEGEKKSVFLRAEP